MVLMASRHTAKAGIFRFNVSGDGLFESGFRVEVEGPVKPKFPSQGAVRIYQDGGFLTGAEILVARRDW